MIEKRIHKIVMFQNGIETLDFFSQRLKEQFQAMGYQIFLFDLLQLETQTKELEKFCEEEHTAMLTFNFEGLGMEPHLYKKESGYFWQEKKIPCFNIVVDHPLYYHDYFTFLPPLFYQISIDRFHENYVKKYYPYVKTAGFLPHAGTKKSEIQNPINKGKLSKPFAMRKYDVAFTGNYTSLEKCEPYFQIMGEEYSAFYHRIAEESLIYNKSPLEEIVASIVKKEIGEPTNLQFAQLMNRARFIDLYVRSFVRGRVIAMLLDHGIKVHVFGDGWEELECLCPENLVITKEISSSECLTVLSDTKIALNVMPWFKDGAHDRIFNSILNGAYCVTDHSIYLDEVFQGEEVGFYDIDHLEKLPSYIKGLLEDSSQLEKKANMAYEKVNKNHTWKVRAIALADLFERTLEE